MGKHILVRQRREERSICLKGHYLEFSIKHKRTKIRRPQTNGKVEYTHWLYDKKFYKK